VKFINNILKWILIVGMAAITIVGAYQVITRYVFNNASSWSEEFIRFLFIWLSMLASAMGLGRKAHVGVDFFINLCPKFIQKAAEWFTHFVIIIFGIALTYLGAILTQGVVKQLSPAMGISMAWVYLAMPVGGILTTIYAIDNMIKMARADFNKKREGSQC